MNNKFSIFLQRNELDVRDVAKIMRDSEWNQQNETPKSRIWFSNMLLYVQNYGWESIQVRDNRKVPGVYSPYHDGAFTAFTLAQILNCKISDIL